MHKLITMNYAIAIMLALAVAPSTSQANEFNITQFGATPDDETDDTSAIENALTACGEAGGGTVFIPAGTFILSRRNSESPILEMPSNTTLCGEGAASILKFDPAVNQSNFWRMIGAPVEGGAANIVIRDLHLDGSNTHQKYIKGETPEHNAGLWFYNKSHVIENVTVMNVLAENFSGDCMAFSYNCRSITVRDCVLRNFIRQGIQMGGSPGSRDYLVTGCRDLEHSVQPGGSTIHVEHARGLTNVIIENNQCRKSILAGGVDGMIIRGNTVTGKIVGNGNSNLVIRDNVVKASSNTGAVVQLGYTKGLIFRSNIIEGAASNPVGLYVWGTSRYNDQPGEDVIISDNKITATETAISLNGTKNVRIHGNLLTAPRRLLEKRTEGLTWDDAESGDFKD
ncbi:MAG TPA: glycosyl hydrolase family 28-related protein [Pirellulaceae bacterium]|nr:right-handed parallel beta-helix repeat-containing protein [Planctomycetales bacterium]MCB9939410.1 right-handed parallel beta-helix repeat-containing protein [Planctomycetaceae bacterium]HRX77484.1 glycosyl hydrolase family 28-related protein [Pirellulaceae bacterium]